MQGRGSILATHVDGCPTGEQSADGRGVARQRRPVQRCGPVLAARVDVRAASEQGADGRGIARPGCEVQGCEPVLAARVDVRAAREQSANRIGVVVVGAFEDCHKSFPVRLAQRIEAHFLEKRPRQFVVAAFGDCFQRGEDQFLLRGREMQRRHPAIVLSIDVRAAGKQAADGCDVARNRRTVQGCPLQVRIADGSAARDAPREQEDRQTSCHAEIHRRKSSNGIQGFLGIPDRDVMAPPISVARPACGCGASRCGGASGSHGLLYALRTMWAQYPRVKPSDFLPVDDFHG